MPTPSLHLHAPRQSHPEDLRHALLHLMQVSDLTAGLSLDGLFERLEQMDTRI